MRRRSCGIISAKTGKQYRFLTEAEWEYVARAGSTSKYPWGDGISGLNAKYARPSRDGTVDVGSYAANAFGVYDTAGNVWEWVEDCWHESYSGAPRDGSAWTTSEGCSMRVLRGGSWGDPRGLVRSANRGWLDTSFQDDYYGFRVSRTLSR